MSKTYPVIQPLPETTEKKVRIQIFCALAGKVELGKLDVKIAEQLAIAAKAITKTLLED